MNVFRRIANVHRAALIAVPLSIALAVGTAMPTVAAASVGSASTAPSTASSTQGGGSLESAARKAGEAGRKIAMSLIGLGLAIASIVLAFRRDFKEAAGVFAVGLVAILLATPAGVNVLHDTVNTLFGSS
jgi:hypothetical protein